jgi:hypothetical protein
MPPSAISGTPASRAARAAFGNRRDLRHARAGNHPRGADRPRTDAHLDAVHAQRDQFAGAFVGGHVAGDQLHFGQLALDGFHGRHHALAVAVRGIDGQHVHLARHQFLRALQKIAGGADRRAHAQTPLLVLGGIGIFQLLLNVLDGDQALQDVVIVHHQQAFPRGAGAGSLRFLERGAHRHGDQIVLGHHFGDRQVEARLEAQIAVGEDAHQLAVLGHRHARDAVALISSCASEIFLIRPDGDGVDDHAAFTALDAVHFFGLPLDRTCCGE